MADHVDITPGTGKTVIADEVTDTSLGSTTGIVQYVKVMDGTVNSFNKQKVNSNGAANVTLMDTAGAEVDPVSQAVFTPRTVTKNFSCTAAAVTANQVLADREALAAVTPGVDIPAILSSINVVNVQATGGGAASALRFHFLKADVSLGTEGAAVSITAGNAVNHLGYVDVAAGDYADLINCQAATISNINLGITPVSGTDDVYCAIEALGSVDLDATTDLHVTFTFL